MLSLKKKIVHHRKPSHQLLKKKPRPLDILKERIKSRLRRLLKNSTNLIEDSEDIVEMVKGLARKELLQRDAETPVQIRELRQAVLDLAPDVTYNSRIVQIEKTKLKQSGLYIKMISASKIAELVPISGKVQESDRIEDILFSKLTEDRFTWVSLERRIGRLAEEEAFFKVNLSMNNAFTKCNTLVNLDYPWLEATPDGLWIKDSRIHAVLEIKVLTTGADIGSLNKGSDVGIRTSRETGELEQRINCKASQQMQVQMLCAGVSFGYLAVLESATGALTLTQVTRNEEMLRVMIERSRAQYLANLPIANRLWHSYLNPQPREDRELLAIGFLISQRDDDMASIMAKTHEEPLSILGDTFSAIDNS